MLPVSTIEEVEKKLEAVLKEVRALKKKQSKKVRTEEPSEYLIKAMKQAEKDWKAGKGSPIFKTGEEAVTWLEKQGL